MPEKWLKSLETMMALTLKNSIFNCYEEMDLDAVKTPEEVKLFQRFQISRQSYERWVTPVTLAEWVQKFPG